MTDDVVVIDVGCGNTSSVMHMFRRIGVLAQPSAAPREAGALVLPGVGSWDAVSERLAASGWRDQVVAHADGGRPVLGICLGMQLLADRSEEGSLPGLSLVPGDIRRLTAGRARVPRVGWRMTALGEPYASPGEERFYYSHSYAFVPAPGHEDVVVGTSDHGGSVVSSLIGRDQILGCQFHPERSHRFGMAFLVRWATAIGIRATW